MTKRADLTMEIPDDWSPEYMAHCIFETFKEVTSITVLDDGVPDEEYRLKGAPPNA